MKYSTLSSSLMLMLASTSFSALRLNKDSQTTIFYGGSVITLENHNQVLVHVNGDLGVEKLINILEAPVEYPRRSCFTIIHFKLNG